MYSFVVKVSLKWKMDLCFRWFSHWACLIRITMWLFLSLRFQAHATCMLWKPVMSSSSAKTHPQVALLPERVHVHWNHGSQTHTTLYRCPLYHAALPDPHDSFESLVQGDLSGSEVTLVLSEWRFMRGHDYLAIGGRPLITEHYAFSWGSWVNC